MNMDWTTEKKGKAGSEKEEKSGDYFADAKAKILAQIQSRLTRDRTYNLCSITGNPKVGKTGLVQDSRTEEEIKQGKKILILDFDDGAEPTWDACWDRDENIIIYCPLEINPDGSTDWEETFNNANNFCQYAKDLIETGDVKSFCLDGVDKAFEGSSDVLRELLVKQQTKEGSIVHATDSVRVSTLDWKIRNRIYNRLLDLVCSLECDRYLITHMKPVYDNINVPTPIGEVPDWHKSTPARFIQMIHIEKVTKGKTTNYVAKLTASKTNPKLVGTEWTIFSTNGENEWFGIPELQEGTL
tara:strand:+ start:9 stop:905 length:897 start_codon:yes stop_codon:yes gene_type:complete